MGANQGSDSCPRTLYMSTAGAGDRTYDWWMTALRPEETATVCVLKKITPTLCCLGVCTHTIFNDISHFHEGWMQLWYCCFGQKSFVKWMPCVYCITFHMQSLLSFACHCLLFYITRETVMWSPQVMARTWSAQWDQYQWFIPVHPQKSELGFIWIYGKQLL